jgi:hypothetical protein
MDSLTLRSYVHLMLARVLSILALLAIVVVTTGAPAHAAKMTSVSEHAVHAHQMTHKAVEDSHSCVQKNACNASDAGLCEFVCAGLTALPGMPVAEAGQSFAPIRHDASADTSLAGRSPELTERPPKFRLL